MRFGHCGGVPAAAGPCVVSGRLRVCTGITLTTGEGLWLGGEEAVLLPGKML